VKPLTATHHRWLFNPPEELLGHTNAVLSGTSTRYDVRDYETPLSIKSMASGEAVWETPGRRYTVHRQTYLILNAHQHYSMRIESLQPATTFCIFFQHGFVEDVYRSTINADEALMDSPSPVYPYTLGFFERMESGRSPLFGSLRRFHRRMVDGQGPGFGFEDHDPFHNPRGSSRRRTSKISRAGGPVASRPGFHA
jgi:hypothetical protein